VTAKKRCSAREKRRRDSSVRHWHVRLLMRELCRIGQRRKGWQERRRSANSRFKMQSDSGLKLSRHGRQIKLLETKEMMT